MRTTGRATALLLVATVGLAGCHGSASGGGAAPTTTPATGSAATPTTPVEAVEAIEAVEAVDGVTVTIAGGHQTDPRDGGRPVTLIASMLGVPTEVFREAFSGVTPAKGGGPTSEEAQANKAALLRVLGPYGITNDQLDEVSNHYRYLASAGQMWPTTDATARAVVVDGRVTAVDVVDGGSGYTSAPTVTITGADGVAATTELAFTGDDDTNGSVTSITLT